MIPIKRLFLIDTVAVTGPLCPVDGSEAAGVDQLWEISPKYGGFIGKNHREIMGKSPKKWRFQGNDPLQMDFFHGVMELIAGGYPR